MRKSEQEEDLRTSCSRRRLVVETRAVNRVLFRPFKTDKNFPQDDRREPG